jgi:hypothetical protein
VERGGCGDRLQVQRRIQIVVSGRYRLELIVVQSGNRLKKHVVGVEVDWSFLADPAQRQDFWDPI